MSKEYKPNYLFNSVLGAIRQELQRVITEAMAEISEICGFRFEVEHTTLWEVMYESAYLELKVNDSGEYTYLRNEKVVGAEFSKNAPVCIITETGGCVAIDEMDAEELSAAYSFIDEVRQRLESGEFVCEDRVVRAVTIETE